MKNRSSVFEETYEKYIQDLESIDLLARATMLGAEGSADGLIIPFFNHEYVITKEGVRGFTSRPDFSLKVLLLKYVLMCPDSFPQTPLNWMPFREFRDSAPLVSYFTNTTTLLLEQQFSGKIPELEELSRELGGKIQQSTTFDLSIHFDALPRIPLLLNFNDADELLPASCSILYRSTTERFIDMECLTMTGTYLTRQLLNREK